MFMLFNRQKSMLHVKVIDQLPLEMRDRFTELRTLDLRVQNGLDSTEDEMKELFKSAPGMTKEDQKCKFEEIKESYKEILEHADEKVGLANTMHDLVERYQRKLSGEVEKFKLELEADSPGITQELEQKVRESEQLLRIQRRELRKKRKLDTPTYEEVGSGDHPGPSTSAKDGRRDGPGRPSLSLHHQFNSQQRRISQSYPNRLSEIRALNASPGSQPHVPSPLIRGPPGSSSTSRDGAFMHNFVERESRHGRPRKLTSRVQEMLKETMDRRKELREETAKSSSTPDSEEMDDDGGGDEEGADEVDQRKWCICNQTSYGEMVACDNPKCPFEWFHYECVKITQPPKGKWFCPHCTETLKRRNSMLNST